MTQYYDLETRTYSSYIRVSDKDMCSLPAVLGDVAWGIWWPALGGHHISYTTSPKTADKEFDKYQHLVSYSDETVIKHVYLNVDDEVLTFN